MQTIIFTGLEISPHSLYRGAGAYRIRTALEDSGYSCLVVDFFQHFSTDEISKLLETYITKETLWIGFSTTFLNTTTEIHDNAIFWENIKKTYPWIKIVSGGSKALVQESTFIDYYITGYADDAVVEFTKNINTVTEQIIDSNKDYNKKDLSNIAIKWKDTDMILPGSSLPMEIARGCIFNCAFCNFPMNNKKKFDYFRNVNNIADELKYNYEHYGVSDYSFMDDTFNDSMQKLELLHTAISKLDFKITYSTYIKPELLVAQPDQIPLLVETGLKYAAYGLESLNPDTRQAIFKMKDPDRILEALTVMHKNSISNQCTMIVGLPHESIESIYNSFDILYNADYIDHFSYYPLTIHNATNYAYTSPIDKNPKGFGYIVKPRAVLKNTSAGKTNGVSMSWYNKYMNETQASRIAEELNSRCTERFKIPVWYRESLLNLGFDVDKHNKEHSGYLHKLPYDELKCAKHHIITNYKAQLFKR